MTDAATMTEQYEGWVPYVRSLALLPESDQVRPIAEGKWAVRNVITHMWKWDEFFWEHGVRPLLETKPLTLTMVGVDFNAFNEKAKNDCRFLEWAHVVEQTAKTREKIVQAIRQDPGAEYDRSSPDADGHPFSIRAFLEDFVHHDAHHRRQIEGVLSGN